MPAAIDPVNSSSDEAPLSSAASINQPQRSAPKISKLQKTFWSLLIAFHLLATVSAPLFYRAQGPRGPSPIVATLAQPTRGYGQFLYIDRGYAFFAPDPGPSHLIQAAITSEDKNRKEIMIPDLDEQWPRLMYHRHFMLAEYLNENYQPKGPPRELFEADRQAAEEWVRLRARYEHLRDSILDHLRKVNPKKEVAIRRLEHSSPELTLYLREPIALDDQRLYRVLLDNPVTFRPAIPESSTSEPDRSASPPRRETNSQELKAPVSNSSTSPKPAEKIPAPEAKLSGQRKTPSTNVTKEPSDETSDP